MKNIKKIGYLLFALTVMASLGVQAVYAQVSTTTIGDNVDEVANTGFEVFQEIVLGKVFMLLVGIALLGYIVRTVLNWLKSGGKRGG